MKETDMENIYPENSNINPVVPDETGQRDTVDDGFDDTETKALLTSDERATVLNLISDVLEENGIDLEIGGYEDCNGTFFDVFLMRR